ncbi:hypothetical protein AQUCO_03400210v1 [Aquilegia coerulea]|uniref:Uncharacterized protein n=1 Tax=Aquilegia coerulea TaxID=218851 RepID=A0A2G5CXZ8_AQUCA|nr:hypothetical protein AQUCO_03400210v1 [Aquilegia coerulea]
MGVRQIRISSNKTPLTFVYLYLVRQMFNSLVVLSRDCFILITCMVPLRNNNHSHLCYRSLIFCLNGYISTRCN